MPFWLRTQDTVNSCSVRSPRVLCQLAILLACVWGQVRGHVLHHALQQLRTRIWATLAHHQGGTDDSMDAARMFCGLGCCLLQNNRNCDCPTFAPPLVGLRPMMVAKKPAGLDGLTEASRLQLMSTEVQLPSVCP